MTTYEEYLRILSQLPPNIQEILRQIWENGRTLSPRELLRIIYLLLASGVDRGLLTRALILLGRLGRFNPGVVAAAMELEAAGAGASASSTSAGGAAAGTAGAGALATAGAILAAILAVALAAYWISTEVSTKVKFPDHGVPCPCKNETGKKETKTLYRRGIGSRTAMQRAIDAAQEDCEDSIECIQKGCDDGTCKPTATIIRTDPRYRVFWTTTHVWYICICRCVKGE